MPKMKMGLRKEPSFNNNEVPQYVMTSLGGWGYKHCHTHTLYDHIQYTLLRQTLPTTASWGHGALQ